MTGAYDAYAAASMYLTLVALQGLIAALFATNLGARYDLSLFWWSMVVSVVGFVAAAAVVLPQHRALKRALERREERLSRPAAREAWRVSEQVWQRGAGANAAPSDHPTPTSRSATESSAAAHDTDAAQEPSANT